MSRSQLPAYTVGFDSQRARRFQISLLVALNL